MGEINVNCKSNEIWENDNLTKIDDDLDVFYVLNKAINQKVFQENTDVYSRFGKNETNTILEKLEKENLVRIIDKTNDQWKFEVIFINLFNWAKKRYLKNSYLSSSEDIAKIEEFFETNFYKKYFFRVLINQTNNFKNLNDLETIPKNLFKINQKIINPVKKTEYELFLTAKELIEIYYCDFYDPKTIFREYFTPLPENAKKTLDLVTKALNQGLEMVPIEQLLFENPFETEEELMKNIDYLRMKAFIYPPKHNFYKTIDQDKFVKNLISSN
jgi:hypothetical protein